MNRTARHWILCALMLLLPLQGLAAGMMSCGKMRAPAAAEQADGATATHHAGHHGDAGKLDSTGAAEKDGARCSACAMCNMCASMMVSSAAHACHHAAENATTAASAPSCKTFHPENPQPPPQLR